MRVFGSRHALLLMTIFLSFILLSQGTFAGVGLSPGSVEFKDMIRGGYAERYLTISNPTDEDVTVTITTEGDINGWLVAEPSEFNMSGISYKVVKVIIRPPDHIPNGLYRGQLLIISKPVLPPEALQGSMIAVASAVSAAASVEISDLQMLRYQVEQIRLPDTEECRPILIGMDLRNTGNVNATPRFHVDVTSTDGGTILQEYDYTSTPILPTTTATVNLRVPYQMEQFKCIPSGLYSSKIESYAGGSIMDSSKLDFHIHTRGTLTVGGEIVEINVPNNVTLGEVVKIEALFKNTGEIPVSAKLHAEVYQGGRLVETVSGDSAEVYMGAVQPLVGYFSPKSGGKHTLLISAAFEDKKSDIKEAEVEVIWPSEYWIVGGVAGAAIAGGIAFFLLRRRGSKSRKRKRGK